MPRCVPLKEILEDIYNPSEMKKFLFFKIFDEAVSDNTALCKRSEEAAVTISG